MSPTARRDRRAVGGAAMVSVLAVVVPIVVSGCLTGFVAGIPCIDDEQCPSDGFCDLTVEACLPDVSGRGGPDVQVTGVVDDDEVVVDPFVPPDATTGLAMVLENVGGHDAVDVTLRMGALACLGLQLDDATVPTEVPAGEAVRVPFTVTPRLCSATVIQDWFTTFSRRGARGTFNIIVERAPPSSD